MRILRMHAALIALASVAFAGHRASGQSNLPPLSTWDVLEADSGGRTIWVKNNTQRPITIEAIVIVRCDNIRQNCGEHPANLVVPPGKSVAAFRIQRIDRRLGWSFQYSFRTKREPLPVGAMPPGVVVGPDGGRSALISISVDSFHAAVAPFTTGASCGTMRIPDLPAGHKALIMVFGTPANPAARRVMARFDANGNAYDYSDTRNDPAVEGAQTSITLDLLRQTGMLRNTAGARRGTGILPRQRRRPRQR